MYIIIIRILSVYLSIAGGRPPCVRHILQATLDQSNRQSSPQSQSSQRYHNKIIYILRKTKICLCVAWSFFEPLFLPRFPRNGETTRILFD